MSAHAQPLDEALALARGGRLREAAEAYRRILAADPRHLPALNNLASVLARTGDLAGAIACYEQALAVRPDMPELHFNLANCLRAAGASERALQSYHRAVNLAPDFAAGHNNLALLQKAVGDLEGAERSLDEAIRLKPSSAETHYNLGTVRRLRGDLAGAQASFEKAIELRSDAAALQGLGEVHEARLDWPRARELYTAALASRPHYARPHCSLGLLLLAEGELDAALDHFDAALTIDPECADAHASRGLVLLSRGDYERGWPEYAWYRRCPGFVRRPVNWPQWEGDPPAGRTMLVYSEHGLGDALQFVRLLPELRRRGAARVPLAVPLALHPLLAESGFDDLVSADGELPPFDVACSLLELPCLLRVTDETIPPAPYLRVGAADIARWRPAVEHGGTFRVGIAWQGRLSYPWDHLRSIPLREFAPLAEIAGVQLVSLQLGEGRGQLAELGGSFPVAEPAGVAERTLVDTAALIGNLDLVIASDSAVAHLAGALGAPVWVALPRGADWRWQHERETSPWYPTMRLFRQRSLGRWDDVFARMAGELAARAGQARAAGQGP
jgi:tetratricopeptide (TPR) repeat protein